MPPKRHFPVHSIEFLSAVQEGCQAFAKIHCIAVDPESTEHQKSDYGLHAKENCYIGPAGFNQTINAAARMNSITGDMI